MTLRVTGTPFLSAAPATGGTAGAAPSSASSTTAASSADRDATAGLEVRDTLDPPATGEILGLTPADVQRRQAAVDKLKALRERLKIIALLDGTAATRSREVAQVFRELKQALGDYGLAGGQDPFDQAGGGTMTDVVFLTEARGALSFGRMILKSIETESARKGNATPEDQEALRQGWQAAAEVRAVLGDFSGGDAASAGALVALDA